MSPTKWSSNSFSSQGSASGAPTARDAGSSYSMTTLAQQQQQQQQAAVQAAKMSNAKRRKAEDKMAMIFVAIVTGFLVTNFPRIFLNFHEVVVLAEAMACSSAGFQ